ncbi:MAG: hypothetical protein AAF456_12135 [Planctomycetota bacterium]
MNTISRLLIATIAVVALTSFSQTSACAQDVSIQVPFSVEGRGQEEDILGNDRFKRGAAMAEARDAARAEIDLLVASYLGLGVTVEVVEESLEYDTRWVRQVVTWYSTCTIDGYLVITGPPWVIEYIFFMNQF